MSASELIHGCVLGSRFAEGWRGVLIEGPSGAGKSRLSLALTAAGWRLVADDYARVWASGGAVYATAPDTIAGRMEVRALGIVPIRHLRTVRLSLAVVHDDAPERLPEPATRGLCGLVLPRLRLDLREPQAAQVIALAARRLSQRGVLA
ncbi:HPr kinase/phosphorylase [Brevundimonas balnearis]|uniref:HPr kinase/phosphorylase n=1 Tax=Brevundimonas balnearis TaxID=1572858 RepID=A0ABV6R210_9CAUL